MNTPRFLLIALSLLASQLASCASTHVGSGRPDWNAQISVDMTGEGTISEYGFEDEAAFSAPVPAMTLVVPAS